jgi:hypothetical protein
VSSTRSPCAGPHDGCAADHAWSAVVVVTRGRAPCLPVSCQAWTNRAKALSPRVSGSAVGGCPFVPLHRKAFPCVRSVPARPR